MKPCRKWKKRIALFEADGSNRTTLAELTSHLNECPGCAEYHRRLQTICSEYRESASEIPAIVECAGSFYSRLSRRIERFEEGGTTPHALAVLRQWRVRIK